MGSVRRGHGGFCHPRGAGRRSRRRTEKRVGLVRAPEGTRVGGAALGAAVAMGRGPWAVMGREGVPWRERSKG